MLLGDFKNFNADRLDIDELVALSAFGESLRAEYTRLQVDEPEWVNVQLTSLRREIRSRTADRRDQRRREIKARLDGLKTPAEKRAELQAELDKLESEEVGTTK